MSDIQNKLQEGGMKTYEVEVNMNTRFVVTTQANSLREAVAKALEDSWVLARYTVNPHGQEAYKDIFMEVNYDNQIVEWANCDGVHIDHPYHRCDNTCEFCEQN